MSVLAFVFLEIFFLWYLQASILGRLKAVLVRANTGMTMETIGISSVIRALPSVLNWTDFFIVGLAIVGAFMILILQIRKNALVNAIESSLQSDFKVNLFILFVGVIYCIYYLIPGLAVEGDASSHISRTQVIARGISSGEMIFWSNYWYLGSPVMQFTGPLYFWITGLFAAPWNGLAGVLWVTKVFLFLLHLCSGLSIAILARNLFAKDEFRRTGCIVTGIAYMASFSHTHIIMLSGAFPQAPVYFLFPLALLCLTRIFDSEKPMRHVLGLGLVCALLLMSHPSMGIYSGWYLIIWTFFWLVKTRFSQKKRFVHVIFAAVLGLVAASYVIVPPLMEGGYVYYANARPFPRIDFSNFGSLLYLVKWSMSQTGPGNNPYFYLGLSIVLLALVGVYYLFRDKNVYRYELTFSAVFSVCVSAPTMRDSLFILAFVALLAGYGSISLVRKYSGAKPAAGLLVLLLVVALDLLPTTIQPLFREDKWFFVDMAEQLEKKSMGHRVIDVNERGEKYRVGIGPGGSPMLGYKVNSVIGPHNLAAPHTHNFASAMMVNAVEQLDRTGSLDRTALDQLYLLNVRYLLFFDRSHYVIPKNLGSRSLDGYSLDPSVPALVLERSSPVIFAPQVCRRDDNILRDLSLQERRLLWQTEERPFYATTRRMSSDIQSWVFDEMGLDRAHGIAKCIAVKNGTGAWTDKDAMPATEPSLEVESFRLGQERLDAKIKVNPKGYLHFSWAFYPLSKVYVDGSQVKPLESALSFLVIPVEAGEHRILVTNPLSQVRVVTLFIFLGACILMLMWMFVELYRDKSK